MALPNADRPQLARTKDYLSGRIEYIIMMPLLRASILDGLERYCVAGKADALDVGCGEQPFRAVLERKGFRYTSFDVGQNSASNVDALGAIDKELPASLVNRGPFDFILCTEVMEHVADWAKAFENLSALLAPGGRLLITCPHIWPLHEEPYDFWRPTPFALRYFADRTKLRIVVQQKLGTGGEVLASVIALTTIAGRGPRPWRFLVHAAYACLKRVAIRVLRSGVAEKFLPLRTGLYLSNFAVLEK